MSRISYSDEEDYDGQFALFRANLGRSLAGKKGQEALKDLVAALEQLPEKQLIPYHLVKDGGVCATGALVAHRMASLGKAREEALAELEEQVAFCGRSSCAHAKRVHKPGCEFCDGQVGRGWDWAKPCEGWIEPPEGYEDEDAEGETEGFAVGVGVPRLVAWRLVELNDMELEHATPEDRYARVLMWARHAIEDPAWVSRDASW